MKKLTIEHLSENGNRKIRILRDVKSVSYDFGYEYPTGVVKPAVKITHGPGKVYVILGAENPYMLTELLNTKVSKNLEVTLPCSIFDFGIPLHEAMLKHEFDLSRTVREIGLEKYWRTDASFPFSPKEWDLMCGGKLFPILKRNTAALSELWAATLPTPGKPVNVPKKVFFNASILQFNASHHPDYGFQLRP